MIRKIPILFASKKTLRLFLDFLHSRLSSLAGLIRMTESEMPGRPKTAFISGPIQPPEGYFQFYYKPPISQAISAGHSFVMGPAPGMDTEALHYLINQGVEPSRITVYFARFQEKLMEDDIRWFVDLGGNIEVEGGTTSERDAAMTRDSDYDILRYMTIEEQKEFYGDLYYPRVSATEKNERRRKGLPLHVNHALVDYYKTTTQVQDGESDQSSAWRKDIEKVLDKISGRS